MSNNKKYWGGLEDLQDNKEFLEASQAEFSKDVQTVDEFLSENDLSKSTTNRRDFLKFLGFSVTAATIAACETPVIHAIPYVNKPENVTIGVPTYYASTYYDGTDYAGVLVKTREGRPILIKGNRKYGISAGSITPRVNASVLSLYDGSRLKGPVDNGVETTWSGIDGKINGELSAIAERGGKIVFLTGTLISPSSQAAIDKFKAQYGGENFEVVNYDPISAYGIRKGNELSFGTFSIPDYDFSKAKVIVSVAADFMNNWLLHNQYVPQYAKNRNPSGDWMSRHFQFEATLSLTGSNADERTAILPSQEGRVVMAIYNGVAAKLGRPTLNLNTDGLPMDRIKTAVDELTVANGEGLLVAGSNDPQVQVVVNAVNDMLGNYGKTILPQVQTYLKQGDDARVMQLVKEMNAGSVAAILINGNINPAYSLPNAEEFAAGLEKVGTTISFSTHADETASKCKYICPDNHYLESWNDFYPKTGHYALAQPTISPLYNTRQFQESLLRWAGDKTSFHDFIRGEWRKISASSDGEDGAIGLFDDFWYNALRTGSVNVQVPASETGITFNTAALQGLNFSAPTESGFEVVLYSKVGIGDGSHAANPWLQELPDPISKVVWDNYIAMNPGDVEELGFKMHLGQELPASLAKLTVDGKSVVLPVVPQPGQKKGSVSVALGYGRGAGGEKIGKGAFRTKPYGGYETDDQGNLVPIGKNVYHFVGTGDGHLNYIRTGATIESAGATYPIASTQTHHTLMDRHSVVKETSLSFFRSNPKEAYNPPVTLPVHEGGEVVDKNVEDISLWREFPVKKVGHHWGMSIDLTACIGCGACVTACHTENNVPVVGKDEVRRGRDMHWMRIDRYYSSDMTKEKAKEMDLGVVDMYRAMEVPEYDNPSTVHMPMMCQHCNHAPCETVCPVLATTHSNEGLNQMTYNRCIGTRYCANNCPFKVRRFNWFNYKAYDKFTTVNPAQDPTARMVLNPDVTVRSRGVMEKCSMCVQRIQEGKLEAKKAGHPVEDGAIQTACAEACPTHAITFGDRNDTQSEIHKSEKDPRTYQALAELGIRPSVDYKVKIRNT